MPSFILNFLEKLLDRASYPQNAEEWLSHFVSEAADGSPQAMTELGWAYIRDDGILPRNEGKSRAWFEMAIVCGGNREVFEYSRALAVCKNTLFFEVIEKAIARDYAPVFFLMGQSLHSGVFAAKDLAGAAKQ